MEEEESFLDVAPTVLTVQEYAAARAQELLAMSKAAFTVTGNALPQQQLPRHMRRRAAGHNVKRLPRTMRNWARHEMAKAGGPAVNKRPSRKYRRRPSNLLQEYRRRQRTFVWLETHIWHAKRFHMTEKWNYKIPLHPNDKGARSAYRASSKYCLLQDLSYYCCVQLEGTEENITHPLSKLTSPKTGLTFAAKVFRSGRREGRTVVYRHDQYPFGALGEVKFMWQYQLEAETTSPSTVSKPDLPTRKLWIWTHPAMFTDFLGELRTVLQAENVDDTQIKEEPQSKEETKDADTKDSPGEITAQAEAEPESSQTKLFNVKQESFCGNGVTVTSLKDTLCRFHLTGPLSNEVLLETLKVANVGSCELPSTSTEEKPSPDSGSRTVRWWEDVFDASLNGKHHEIHNKQTAIWDTIKHVESPGELESNCILGLTVRDPRVLLPPRKAMVQYDNKVQKKHPLIADLPTDSSWSPIWDSDVRANVKATKIPDSVINNARSEALVPGSEVNLGDEESKIPVLLVQNPGRQPSAEDSSMTRAYSMLDRPGYGSGWDLIVPGGWAMPFLIGLVHRGAKVAGLKEIHSLAVEQGVLSFPNNYPDTPAGKEWSKWTWAEKQAQYDRKPPAKKVNFSKMSVASPVHFPWVDLLKEWNVHESGRGKSESAQNYAENFYVMRNKTCLRKIQALCSNTVKQGKSGPPPFKVKKLDRAKSTDIEVVFTGIPFQGQCLVPVAVGVVLRGKPAAFSMICMPSEEELKSFMQDNQCCAPKEPIKKDLPKASKKKRRQKYEVPPRVRRLMNSCSRPIIGYITDGNFSFASGHGYGVGFVALAALKNMLTNNSSENSNKSLVLLRSTTSLQYRFAYISILCH